MTKPYASVELGGTDRNVEYLGAFIAWLASNDMLAETLVRDAGSAVARVRMQDLTGPAFLTTVLHGDIRPEHLNDNGRRLVEQYFVTGAYRTDYESCEYKGDDEWLRYDEVAPKITSAWRRMSAAEANPVKRLAKVIRFPGARKDPGQQS